MTKTQCVQIWQETQPKNLILIPSPDITWAPTPLGYHEIPIMELATQVYNKQGSKMIHRCHLYLQVLSILDLYLTSSHMTFS